MSSFLKIWKKTNEEAIICNLRYRQRRFLKSEFLTPYLFDKSPLYDLKNSNKTTLIMILCFQTKSSHSKVGTWVKGIGFFSMLKMKVRNETYHIQLNFIFLIGSIILCKLLIFFQIFLRKKKEKRCIRFHVKWLKEIGEAASTTTWNH